MGKVRQYDEVLPYLHYEDGVYIYKDGRVCCGLEVFPYEYELFTGDSIAALGLLVNRVFNDLPDYANVQLLRWCYEGESGLEVAGEGLFNQAFGELARGRRLRTKLWLFIELMPKKYSKSDVLTTLFSKGGIELSPKAFSGVDALKQACYSAGSDMLEALCSAPGLSARRLGYDDFEQVVKQVGNLDCTRVYTSYELDANNLDSGKLTLGAYGVSVISLHEQGALYAPLANKPYAGDENSVAHPLTYSVGADLQIPHITVVNLRKLSKEVGLAKFKSELKYTDMLPDLRFFKALLTRRDSLDAAIAALESQPHCLCELSASVVAWGVTAEERRERTEQAKQALKKVENCKIIEESVDAANLFFAAFPGNGSQNFRRVLVPSLVGVGYLNFEGDYASDSAGEVMTDRFGNPVLVSFTHPGLNSQNEVKVGPTGSGKSYSEGATIVQAYQRGDIMVIFDKGGSYRNLFESIGEPAAKYIEHTEESPFRLNPFYCPYEAQADGRRKYLLDGDKVTLLRTLVSLLSKNKEIGEQFTTAESAVTMRLIPLYYEYAGGQPGVPTLKKFCAWLEGHAEGLMSATERAELNVQRLLIVLHPYTEGVYGTILNSESEIDLASYKLLCFDLEHIQKDKLLYPIVTMQLIELVMQHIAKFPSVYKQVKFDEAWSFLSGDMVEFIEYLFRTVRKHHGRVTIITQSVADIKKSEVGGMMLNNSHIISLLNHTGQDLALVREVLDLDEREMSLLASMRLGWQTWDGRRGGREALIKRKGVDSKVYGVEVPLLVAPILTSKPSERNHFNKLKEQHEFNRAVLEWVADKKAGVI
jgi:hypothetical protein